MRTLMPDHPQSRECFPLQETYRLHSCIVVLLLHHLGRSDLPCNPGLKLLPCYVLLRVSDNCVAFITFRYESIQQQVHCFMIQRLS